MNAVTLSDYWQGTLLIELRGNRVSDVISLLQSRRIRIMDVQWRSNRCRLRIGLQGFGALYAACRQTGCKLRIVERDGLPFAIQAAWRRKFFWMGSFLFVVVLYVLSSMIWRIDISGLEGDAKRSLQQTAQENGLYVGAWKSRLPSLETLQRILLDKMPGLSWVGLNIDGVYAHIQAVGKIPGVAQLNTEPRDIVAAKPGVIRNVFATRGQVLVKPGQLVRPGQIVISGNLADGKKRVRAEGSVLAEVWYRTTVTVPLEWRQSTLSGESGERQYIRIGNTAVRVWGWKELQFKAVAERVQETDWRVGDWVLPVQWQWVRVYEVNERVYAAAVDSAKSVALSLALQDVRAHLGKPGAVLGQTVLHQEVSHGKLYETILTRTEEDIGR